MMHSLRTGGYIQFALANPAAHREHNLKAIIYSLGRQILVPGQLISCRASIVCNASYVHSFCPMQVSQACHGRA